MKMNNVLMKLHLVDEKGEPTVSPQIKARMEQVVKLQEDIAVKKLDDISIGLSKADKMRKQSNYIWKLKMCIKIYSKLNEKLTEELKVVKS